MHRVQSTENKAGQVGRGEQARMRVCIKSFHFIMPEKDTNEVEAYKV